MRPAPFYDSISEPVVHLVRRRLLEIQGPVDVIRDLGENLNAKRVIGNKTVTNKGKHGDLCLTPVHISVPEGLITQVLDGPQKLPLNSFSGSAGRDKFNPKGPCLFDVLHRKVGPVMSFDLIQVRPGKSGLHRSCRSGGQSRLESVRRCLHIADQPRNVEEGQ